MALKYGVGPLLVAALALAGCDTGDAPAADDAAADSEATANGEAGQAVAGEAGGADAALQPGTLVPINQSGVRGGASILAEGDERVITLEVEGLEAGTRYTAHVHEGRCADGGPIRLPLGRVLGSEDGTGSTRMRVEASRLPADADLFVQLHGPDDRPVACADVGTGDTVLVQ